jgi:hypothetical protein
VTFWLGKRNRNPHDEGIMHSQSSLGGWTGKITAITKGNA